MPLRTSKTDTAEALTLEWILHVKNFRLNLVKDHCVGCQICSLACPKEAIKHEKQPKTPGQKTRKAKVDIDLAKCNFCGICDILCPYGAITVSINREHLLSVLEKESFPQLVRDIRVDPSRLPLTNNECKEACPLSLIEVTRTLPDGKIVEDANSLTRKERFQVQTKIDIEKQRCPCCRACESKCPNGTIQINKFIQGKITINPSKCPEGCKDCLDVCPITGALYLSESDKKVRTNDMLCVYCGACKAVCPVEDALELRRTKISHTSISSGAWNKALERLTSTTDMSKELKAKGSQKAVESVGKLLVRTEE